MNVCSLTGRDRATRSQERTQEGRSQRMSKDKQYITPQRAREHFTVTEEDGDNGGLYIPKVHHPYTAPGV